MRIAIVGGGISGLTAAVLAVAHGHDVTVIDRDVDPPEGGADALASWERRGVPQAHFAHYFQARATSVLSRELPHVLDEMLAAGALWRGLDFGPDAPNAGAIASRRPVYEGVLRRHIRSRDDVEMLTSTRVTGLLTEGDGSPVPHVRGVRLGTGDELEADLVIDAGGRRSGSDGWLERVGAQPLAVDDHPVRVHYFSRHYRLREGQEYPHDDVPFFVPLPYVQLFVFLGDNRTFSVGAAVAASDPLRRHLRDPEVFDRLLRAVGPLESWLDRTDPVTPVYVMAGLSNRRRRLVVDGAPLATGFATVGDASIYTNPTRGQGIGLSVWMADHLVDLLDRAPDTSAAVVAQEAFIDDLLEDRFALQIRVDDATDVQLEAGARGEGWVSSTMHPDDAFLQAAWAVAQEDPEVRWRVLRVSHMLDPTRALRDHDRTCNLIREHLARQDPDPSPPPDLLPRADFERLVTL